MYSHRGIVIFVLVGIVFGWIIADPLIQLLALSVEGNKAIENHISDYFRSLSDKQLIYGLFISIILLGLLLPAYNKLKASIENESKSE